MSTEQVIGYITPEILAQIFTSFCTISGMYFVGKRKTFGWLFTIANGLGWGVLLAFSGQYIMYIPLSVMLIVSVKNYRKWRADDLKNAAE